MGHFALKAVSFALDDMAVVERFSRHRWYSVETKLTENASTFRFVYPNLRFANRKGDSNTRQVSNW